MEQVHTQESMAETTDARARASASGITPGFVRQKAAQYAYDALEVLRKGLDAKNERVKFACARDLVYVFARLPIEKGEEPPKAPTAEEREARAAAAAETPEVRDFLVRRGWTPPEADPRLSLPKAAKS